MNTPTTLAAFGAALAFAFGGAYAVGGSSGWMNHNSAAMAEDISGHDMGNDMSGDTDQHGTDDHSAGGTPNVGATASPSLPGLMTSSDGYTLNPTARTAPVGTAVPFRFTITGPDGKPLTSYTPSHTKDLHLIVVRRDLTGFQHLHPSRASDGTWSTSLRLTAAGSYRALADFIPNGMTSPLVLGTDLSVAGDYQPVPLPAVAATTMVDGYDVAISGTASATSESQLTFTVSRGGRPVTDLEPYLGAFGHLVALRMGDLAYLHTHPGGSAAAGMHGGPSVSFMTELPSRGSYRLFLNFQTSGRVHTAAFTVTVS